MTVQQAACLALFSHCQTEPLPGLLRSDQSGRQTEQVQDSPSSSTTHHSLAQDPLGQFFPAGFSPQTPPPWSVSHGNLLYQSYYPVGYRQMVKSVCKHCVVCRKALAKTIIQFMGDLPDHRISPARPFDYTGVDFAGPFDVKRGHTRKPVLVKAYACLFVCMSTKAVRIECTEDLSTASFMLCFKRFINRRGFPQHVYSDNGSNFICAARTLGTPTQLP